MELTRLSEKAGHQPSRWDDECGVPAACGAGGADDVPLRSTLHLMLLPISHNLTVILCRLQTVAFTKACANFPRHVRIRKSNVAALCE
jgi:hypothetical protein